MNDSDTVLGLIEQILKLIPCGASVSINFPSTSVWIEPMPNTKPPKQPPKPKPGPKSPPPKGKAK